MKVALIDYGAGNLTSVRKALAAVGAEVVVPREPEEIGGLNAAIVPGVGHFQATAALDEAWRQAIIDFVGSGRPLLGICLGMQWLFESSAEAPGLRGLGLLAGRCKLLGAGNTRATPARPRPERNRGRARVARQRRATDAIRGPVSRSDVAESAIGCEKDGRPQHLASSALKVPHVGWNSLQIVRSSRLLEEVADGSQVYFTHSYAAPVTSDCVATTTHGDTFAAMVERDNVFGVQFHPEKSGDVGLIILRTFLSTAAQPRLTPPVGGE